MKKVISMLCLVMASVFAIAQDKSATITPYKVPVDSITKKITYEGVVDVKGVAAGELYQRINAWFMAYYKNPTEVIRENDSINHKMIGKPRFRLSNLPDKNGVKSDGGVTQYNEYLQQLDKTALEVIASLKKAVTEAKAVKNKDNW